MGEKPDGLTKNAPKQDKTEGSPGKVSGHKPTGDSGDTAMKAGPEEPGALSQQFARMSPQEQRTATSGQREATKNASAEKQKDAPAKNRVSMKEPLNLDSFDFVPHRPINADPVDSKPKENLREVQLVKEVEAIHRLITHDDSWIGAFQVADIKGINGILQYKTQEERIKIKNKYQEMYKNTSLEDDVRKTSPAWRDLINLYSVLDRKDDNIANQNAWRIFTALSDPFAISRSRDMIDKDIRDTLATMASKDITQLREEFAQIAQAYKGLGIKPDLFQALTTDSRLSKATKAFVATYYHGNDNQDYASMATLAKESLKEQNLTMFAEVMRDAKPEYREFYLTKGEGRFDIKQAFGGRFGGSTKELRHALDYAKYGKLSAKTQIEDNYSYISSYLNNNEGIELAIKGMSDQEQKLFKQGKTLVSEKKPHEDQTREEQEAVAYYRDLRSPLYNTGSNSSNLEKWENMMAGSENSFVVVLARHHGIFENSSFAEIVKDIDLMSEKDWNYCHENYVQARNEFRDMIRTLGKSISQIDQLNSMYDQKIQPGTYAEAKNISFRSVIDHINDDPSKPAIIAAIENMPRDERYRYHNDQSFRAQLDRIVTGRLSPSPIIDSQGRVIKPDYDDTYLKSGQALLAQISTNPDKPAKEDIIYKLQHIAAGAASDAPVRAADEIARALDQNKELSRIINKPATDDERAYARAFEIAAKSAAQEKYELLVVPVIEPKDSSSYDQNQRKMKALAQRLTYHDGFLNDDIEGIVNDLLIEVPTTELRLLATSEPGDSFANKYFGFLNPAQQKIVTEALSQKGMKLEDKIRAKYLGWGGSSDIVGLLKEIEPKSEKPEDIIKFKDEIKKCRDEYFRKYNSSLDTDLHLKLSSREYDQASKVLSYGLSIEERANIARDEIQKTLSGFGAWYVATIGRSAAGDQALAANNAMVQAMTALNTHVQAMPADQVLALQTRLAEVTKVAHQAADNHTESKHAAAEYTAMAVTAAAGGLAIGVARAALIKAGMEGMKASLLLGLAASSAGGITNPLIRAGIEGKSYDDSLTNIAMQSGEGAVQAMLLLAPQSIASAFGIGSKAATAVMEKTADKLGIALGEEAAEAFLSQETKGVLRQGILDSLQEAIATGKEKISKQTMDRLIEKLTKQASAGAVPQELRRRLPKAIEQAFKDKLENMPKEIAHRYRFLLQHGLNTGAGGLGGAASSAIQGGAEFDPDKSADENLKQLLTQLTLGTGTGAAAALAIGLALHGTGKVTKMMFKEEQPEGHASSRQKAAGEEPRAAGRARKLVTAEAAPPTRIFNKVDDFIAHLQTEGSPKEPFTIRLEKLTKEDLEKLTKPEVAPHVKSLTIGELKNIKSSNNLAKLTNLESLEVHRCLGVDEANSLLRQIGEMKNLRRLDLSNNTDIRGSALSYLKSLKNLEELNLKNNSGLHEAGGLEYALPLSPLRHLAQLTDLKRLDISDCLLIDSNALKSLRSLKNLEWLNLSQNGFITDSGIRHLENLSNLVYLNLDRTDITKKSFNSITKLTKLEELSLKHTGIKRTEAGRLIVEEGTAITQEDVSNAWKEIDPADRPEKVEIKLDDETVIIRQITELPKVDPARVDFLRDQLRRADRTNGVLHLETVTDRDLEIVANLATEQNIQLEGIHVISRTRVTEAGLAHLSKLTSLEELSLCSPYINDKALAHLENLTNLRKLNLSNSGITGEGLVHLSKLKNLARLELAGNTITNSHLKHLAEMTNLEALNLSKTWLKGGNGMEFLNNLAKLQELKLTDTGVDDGIFANLKHLTRLRSLDLSYTKVTGAELNQLAGKQIVNINLSNTPFNHKYLEDLGKIDSSKYIGLSNTGVTEQQFLDTWKDPSHRPQVSLGQHQALVMTPDPANDLNLRYKPKQKPSAGEPIAHPEEAKTSSPEQYRINLEQRLVADDGHLELKNNQLMDLLLLDSELAKKVKSIKVTDVSELKFSPIRTTSGKTMVGDPCEVVFKRLGSLPSLTSIDFSDCKGFSNRHIAHIAKARNLEYVNLAGTRGIGLVELQNLRNNLPNLKKLDLRDTGITESHINHVWGDSQNRPEILWGSRSEKPAAPSAKPRASDDAAHAERNAAGEATKFRFFDGVTELISHISKLGPEDRVAVEIEKLTKKDLDNLVSEKIAPHIGTLIIKGMEEISDFEQVLRLNRLNLLPNLTKLDLTGCSQINDLTITQIVQLKNLRILNLRQTNISNVGVTQLCVASHLEVLSLADNKNITKRGLKLLPDHMTKLKELDLRRTGIGKADFDSVWKKNRPRIIHFDEGMEVDGHMHPPDDLLPPTGDSGGGTPPAHPPGGSGASHPQESLDLDDPDNTYEIVDDPGEQPSSHPGPSGHRARNTREEIDRLAGASSGTTPGDTAGADPIADQVRKIIEGTAQMLEESLPESDGHLVFDSGNLKLVFITLLDKDDLKAAIKSITFKDLNGATIPEYYHMLEYLHTFKNLTSISFRDCKNFDDGLLEQIGKVEKLERIDVSGTPVTRKGLVYLNRIPDLKEVDARRTKITQDDVDAIWPVESEQSLDRPKRPKVKLGNDRKGTGDTSSSTGPDKPPPPMSGGSGKPPRDPAGGNGGGESPAEGPKGNAGEHPRDAADQAKSAETAAKSGTSAEAPVLKTDPEIIAGWRKQLSEKNGQLILKIPTDDELLDAIMTLGDQVRSLKITDDARIIDSRLAYLAGLKNLQHLDLSGAKITDAGLAHLKNLKCLQHLDLNQTINHGKGGISDAGLVHLKDLTELRHLNLFNSRVTDAGLAHLKGLINLEYLDLRKELIALEKIKISDAGLAHLNEFTKLRHLDLSGNAVTDTGLSHLAGLSDLQYLDLSYSSEITDSGLKHLRALNKLEHLSLTDAQITDAGLVDIQKFENLTHLDLADTKITDKGMPSIQKLNRLTHLNLWGTEITDKGLAHITKLDQLKSLNLTACENLTDSGFIHLKGLSKIEYLGIGSSKLTDAGLTHLNGLTNMKCLDISHAAVTDAGLAHLEAFQILRQLWVNDTKISDAGLHHLAKLPKIKEIDATQTAVTRRGIKETWPNRRKRPAISYSL